MTLESIERLRKYADDYPRGIGVQTAWSTMKEIRELADAIEKEVDERCMPLPLDADGVPIRVGDEMLTYNGRRETVTAISVSGWNDAPLRSASDARHVKPRTVEDVFEDFLKYAVEPVSKGNRDISLSDVHFCVDKEKMREFASELQMREGGAE